MNPKYSVYWIKHAQHENVWTEGYVGISADLEYRIKRYKQAGQKSHLYEKFASGAQVQVIAKGLHQHEALLLEQKLRPTRNIGWNKNSGGFMPAPPVRRNS